MNHIPATNRSDANNQIAKEAETCDQIHDSTDGSGVDVLGEQGLEANAKKYTLAFVKQNGENKYVLLDYVPHPSEKDVTMIYSIVLTTDEKPETVKQFLDEKTWKPFDHE